MSAVLAAGGASMLRREGDRLVWTGDGETVVVEPWGADSLRVRTATGGSVVDADWALLPQARQTPVIEIGATSASIAVGRIRGTITVTDSFDAQLGYGTSTCRIAFHDEDGGLLLTETDRGGSLKLRPRAYAARPGGLHRTTVTFEAGPDEHLTGMGQYQQDLIDLAGSTLELAHRNSQASVPFVVSSRGYGFLWHCPAIGRATFAANRTEWVAEAARQVDYWITAGRTPADISRAYAAATGFAPEMPDEVLGFWQCKLRYWNQEQLLEVAREHHRRGIPLDVIVADFFHWPKMGDYRFEEEFWPNPAAMVEELDSMGVRLMVSVWPQVSIESENFDAFRRVNGLVTTDRGIGVQMAFEGPSMFVDTTSPAGRELLWDLCRRNYFDHGVKHFWLDEAEPEYGAYDFDLYRYHAGTALEVGNLYPQLFARAFFDGQRAAGQTDVVNLIRCAWAGSQRYGALVWSGDIGSTFTDLKRQIVAALHMGVAGIPWFTTDIGGFHQGDPDSAEFRELLIRWFQFAAFCPVMRLHGDRAPSRPVLAADGSRRSPTGADNEVWSFGDAAYDILLTQLQLRESMRPYLRRIAGEAHTDGQPMLRGLFHEFPDDPRVWSVSDEYLFGPDLLVAPVVEPGARSRSVYLPLGAEWIDLGTGRRHPGGTLVEADAPLERIPVFARDGADHGLAEVKPYGVR